MDEKLQKVLARAGYGSRREIEKWITLGRLKINGRLASLGDRVSSDDKINLDGTLLRNLQIAPRIRVIAYHKPEGEMCTRHDPESRPTIFEHLPTIKNGRWIAVGRLDINTSGLILLTTDGELANKLMHPSMQVEREYAVRVLGDVSNDTLRKLQQSVQLEDGRAHFDRILDAGGTGVNHWYHVVLKEGRNREVRRLWEAVGTKVSRLMRIRYADIVLSRALRPGKWRELEQKELQSLLQAADMQNKDGIEEKEQSRHNKKQRNMNKKTQHNKKKIRRPTLHTGKSTN